MSAELSADVVEFGQDQALGRDPAPRRWSGLVTEPRTALALLVLGAVAAVASLVGEWQVVVFPADRGTGGGFGFDQDQTMVRDVWSVGTAGTFYLLILVSLSMLISVALYGPPAGRQAARVAGLGLGVVSLVALALAVRKLSDSAAASEFLFGMSDDMADRVEITPERGVWAACATVALLALALLSTHLRARAHGEPQGSPWVSARSSRDGTATPNDGDEDIELTVTAAAPFVRQY